MKTKTHQTPCLRIAVPLPIKGTFTYTIPPDLVQSARVGCRVLVPFKKQRLIGYIVERIHQDEAGLKPILDVVDPEPIFSEKLVTLFEWMAEYYLCPIGQVIKTALPGGFQAARFKSAVLTEAGHAALDSPGEDAVEGQRLGWVKAHPGKRLPWPREVVRTLEERGYIHVEERVKGARTGPLMRTFVRVRQGTTLDAIQDAQRGPSRAAGEDGFLRAIFNEGPMLVSALNKRFSNGSYLVDKWVRKGVLKRYKGPVYRNPAGELLFPSPVPERLFQQQARALEQIRSLMNGKAYAACLLYGITGSGKTEVYYKAVEHAVLLGCQAILMVPEISLATYLEGVFRSRMGERVAIYHSGLSQGERYDEWLRMVRGEVDVVIGARSALFSPLPRPGLFIVDEEHDGAYKQESQLRYQARDGAVMRARIEGALVLLGSGTPSVQSYYNGISGRYHLLTMAERVERRPLPLVTISDMRAPGDQKPDSEMLGPELTGAIEENLAAENQTILFLNRRGFHRLLLCSQCGESARCPNCDVALTFHRREDRLSCHYCGYHSGILSACGSCGSEGLKTYGFGTEKLEHELAALFPGARISRLDTDTARKKGQGLKILKRFSDHETDILVGTQMITKGYDFPKVTLVGVIAADLSLAFPDFRAGERTFQILSQVAGRAGRGERGGRVIIQTFNPDHYAIQAAMSHDYEGFFEREKALRASLSYPPFSHLTCVRLEGNSQKQTAEAATRAAQQVKHILRQWPRRGKEVTVLGPAEAPISRLKGKYRWQILLKSRRPSLLQPLLGALEASAKRGIRAEGGRMIIDVDPYQMI